MGALFDNLEILEKWFVNGVVKLDDYFKLKSNLVDYYVNKKKKKKIKMMEICHFRKEMIK